MNEGSNDLWQELSAMADAFGDLGRTMLIASRQLQNPGVLPSTSVDEQLAELRRGFGGLRDRSCRLAEALGVEAPAESELTSLKSLVGLLELVGAAEANRDRAGGRRGAGTGVARPRPPARTQPGPGVRAARRMPGTRPGAPRNDRRRAVRRGRRTGRRPRRRWTTRSAT